MAGKNAGRSGHRMRVIKQHIRATETHCYRCGQRIDWSIPYRDDQGKVNPECGTVEHKIPRTVAPHLAEDLGNLAASHARCNYQAGERSPALSMGVRTRSW